MACGAAYAVPRVPAQVASRVVGHAAARLVAAVRARVVALAEVTASPAVNRG